MFVKKQDALPKVVHMREDVLLWFWSLCVFADSGGESEGDLQLRVKLWSSTATSASPWWCHPDTSLFNHCFSKYLCFRFVSQIIFYIREYFNTRIPWRVDFAVRQVDYRITCLEGQVKILDKLFSYSRLHVRMEHANWRKRCLPDLWPLGLSIVKTTN